MSDNSSNTPESLVVAIVKSYVHSVFPEGTKVRFIPQDSLDNLITSESVAREFSAADAQSGQSAKQPTHEGGYDYGLVEFVLSSAKKIFTISLLCGLRSGDLREAMIVFKAKHFGDSNLPVSFQDNQWIHDRFAPPLWDFLKTDSFAEKQWALLAPVFPKEFKEELKLENKQILPFTFVDPKKKEGTFGTVYEVTIHPSHQIEPMLKVRKTWSFCVHSTPIDTICLGY